MDYSVWFRHCIFCAFLNRSHQSVAYGRNSEISRVCSEWKYCFRYYMMQNLVDALSHNGVYLKYDYMGNQTSVVLANKKETSVLIGICT